MEKATIEDRYLYRGYIVRKKLGDLTYSIDDKISSCISLESARKHVDTLNQSKFLNIPQK